MLHLTQGDDDDDDDDVMADDDDDDDAMVDDDVVQLSQVHSSTYSFDSGQSFRPTLFCRRLGALPAHSGSGCGSSEEISGEGEVREPLLGGSQLRS